MEEQANNLVDGPVPGPKKNAGWFRAGDQRINRDGRPKLAWAGCEDRAPCAGRLMLLWVPRQEFVQRLASSGEGSLAGIINLPLARIAHRAI